jgi:hypothetical protein
MSQVGIATAELGSRVPRKAKVILDRLVGSRTMTQEGMEWLICATDPFHDDKIRCPGYPDMSTVNSVVQTFTSTKSYSAPSGQTAPWDLHVGFLPASTPQGVHASGSPGKNNFVPWGMLPGGILTSKNAVAAGPALYPGYNAIVEPTSGNAWYLDSAAINDGGLAIPAKYCSGHFRLIGGGIECVNTTADLYKGGSLTAYRSPSEREMGVVTTNVSVGGTTTSTSTITATTVTKLQKTDSRKEIFEEANVNLTLAYPVEVVSTFPTTQAEAALFTDSRTWAAEDGCYSVLTQADIENPYTQLVGGEVLVAYSMDASSFQTGQSSGAQQNVYLSNWYDGSNSFSYFGQSASQALPFSQCGFVLAGLNPNSTIQLTQRLFFERIPSTLEPDLLAMAQVPPAHDAVAVEIYSRVLAAMPVAVPVSENPLGEWFNSILDSIKSVAPKLGGIIRGVGTAISEIGGTQPVQSNATPQRKQNNKQKQAFKNNAIRGPQKKAAMKNNKLKNRNKGPARRPPTRKP